METCISPPSLCALLLQVSTLLGALTAHDIVSGADARATIVGCVSAPAQAHCLFLDDWQPAIDAMDKSAVDCRAAKLLAQQAEEERLRRLEKWRQAQVCSYCCSFVLSRISVQFHLVVVLLLLLLDVSHLSLKAVEMAPTSGMLLLLQLM